MTLDTLENIAEFPSIIESLDADTLIGILDKKPRWTSARWHQLLDQVCLKLGELDPELALETAGRI